jgi:hypothetical protein
MATWTPAIVKPTFWIDFSRASSLTLDGSSISQADDLSGNGRHATRSSTTRPTLSSAAQNGLAMASFNGSSPYLDVTDGLPVTTDMTLFSVFGRASAGIHSIILGNTASANPYGLWWYSDNVRYSALTSATTSTTHGTASTATGCFLGSLRRNSSGVQLWVDGAAVGTQQQAPVLTTNTLTTIGRRTTTYHSGTIGETIVFLSALSQADREKIEGYLAHKWGLTGSLPSGHPYKSSAPVAYALSGAVLDSDGDPVARTIRAYLDSSGELVGSATSDASTGEYEIVVGVDDPHTLVASGESGKASLILSGVEPV